MSGEKPFGSALSSTLHRYLDLKEALGRRYKTERAVFEQLDKFLLVCGSDLTAETYVRWCRTQHHLSPTTRRKRMQIVRNLCLYRRRCDPTCFVPDPSEFPLRSQPVQPYLFSEREIACLLHTSDTLRSCSRSPLRREVFRLAIVLLYTTGLRHGELRRLVVGDYDPRDRTLLVRATKFHKSRLLPLSPDGARELDAYLETRCTHTLPVSPETPLIWNSCLGGRAYSDVGLGDGIRRLFKAVGIRTPQGRFPRVHDFRHSFAVHALVRWYRVGADVQAKLPYLMTYMGHSSILSTQYYLHFVDDLAKCASERFARRCGALVTAPSQTRGCVR